jgi:glucose-6-phosphate 1-dehydrogenase
MVDMIQSHLLQVMSLVAMEAPPTLGAADLRDCKAQVLRATRVWGGDPTKSSFRARYTSGEVDGRRLPSYVDEEGIDPERGTETLAEVVLEVDTWRWAGVPFRLRSGKAIGSPRKEIAINFREPPLIPSGLTGCDRPDRLRIGINPGGGRLLLDLNISGPGDPWEIDQATLEADFGAGELQEYGEVLKGVLEGDPTLSVRGDMAVDCWRVIEPVQKAWRAGDVPLEEYPAGSGGPDGWPL